MISVYVLCFISEILSALLHNVVTEAYLYARMSLIGFMFYVLLDALYEKILAVHNVVNTLFGLWNIL